MRRLFVTGTDTGVGKTTVSTAVLSVAGERGFRCVGVKPVESGCPAGAELGPDGTRLLEASTVRTPPGDISAYCLERPLSPNLAARYEDVDIRLDVLVELVRRNERRDPDLLLVEGAGGLLVPINDEYLIADVAAALMAEVVIVARDSLGTINHTVLTVEAARARGLRVAGVVLNQAGEATAPSAVAENRREIERLADVPVLTWIPRLREGVPLPLDVDVDALLPDG